MKKNKKLVILIVFYLFAFSFLSFSFTDEDKQQIHDYVKATKDSLEQAKGKFDYVIEKWNKFVLNRYQTLPKKYHPLINKLNKQVMSKIRSTNSRMDSFIKYATKYLESEQKLDSFVAKAKNFIPNKDNPYNAVDAMLAAMREIDEATKTEWKDFKTDPVSSSLKFMINSFNKYFYEAVNSCRAGLVKAQKLIKERGGRCFGGKGGEELAGSQMERAWARLTKGSKQLCPTGLRTRNLDEVWISQQDNEPWIWDSRHKEWVKLGNKLSDVQNLFDYYFFAYGRKIPTNEVINWIRKKPRRFKELESAAMVRFNALSFSGLNFTNKSCKEHILSITGYEKKRAKILEECGSDLTTFKGKYIFSKPSYMRSDSNTIYNILTNTYEFRGKIREKGNDKPIKKAKVNISVNGNSKSKETDEKGKFRMLVKGKVSSSKRISIQLTHDDFEDKTIDTVVSEQCADLGIMEMEKSSEIEGLVISPSNTTIKVGETANFTVFVRYKDGRQEKISNSQVTFSGAPNGVFKGTEEGTFTITASYDEYGTSATVTVKKEEEGEKDVDDAIKDIKDENKDKTPEEQDQCSLQSLNGIASSINETISEITSAYSMFLNYYSKFNQEINKQSSKVCKNSVIAYCYSQAINLMDKISTLTGDLREKGVNLILLSAICPQDENNSGPSIKGIISALAGQGKYESLSRSKWGEMNGRLRNDFNCDENEIRERGDRIIPSEMDPDFLQGGGTMTEVEGDGVDNDGNGLQDDSIVELAGYNVTFVLYDSGNLKDDMFTLSVSGFGMLGTTPRGGLQAFGLNLSPGTYTATVTCILAPDNVGTFTLNIIQNGKIIGSISGAPPQGGGGTVTFTVK